MGISETALAKAQAAVSQAEANVATITAELAAAQKKLSSTSSAGEALEGIKDMALLGSLTSGMRDKVGVDEVQLQADVDRLTAALSAARDKLNLARKAQDAVETVVGE